MLDDVAQMVVELNNRGHIEDAQLELAFHLVFIARAHLREQLDVAALGHNGQNLSEHRVALRKRRACDLGPLLGRVRRVFQSA